MRQAAALAVPVDGTGLVIQQFGARGFVVFGAVGQRIIDGFAAGFADVLRLSVAGKTSSVVSDTADLSAPRGARVVRLRQPDRESRRAVRTQKKKIFSYLSNFRTHGFTADIDI
ncbi:MAG: hypothetical protein ACLR4A_19015 [Christensenellales bacterium]